MQEDNKSTMTGAAAFFNHYGEPTPASMSKFLGISEKQFVERYWKVWKKNNEKKIN